MAPSRKGIARWSVVAALIVATALVRQPPAAQSLLPRLGDAHALGGREPDLEITEADLRGHLEELEAIADAHGGNRADGTPGFTASVDYVTARLAGAGYAVTHAPVVVGEAWSATGEVERSTNVVAEWPGTTDEVVVLGAHLDSVDDGPGINDNGSGVAGVLEIAEQLAAADVPTERAVRVVFWGAEEVGLVGSRHYVASLSPADRERIAVYLNADMIASPNYVRGVYDPAAEVGAADAPPGARAAPGSTAISERFYDYFASIGLATVPIATDGESDDAAFAAAGIPTGGVFTGAFQTKTRREVRQFGGTAGEPTDPCYHQPCDDLDHVDLEVASQLAQGLGVVTVELAGVAAPGAVPLALVAVALAVEPSYVG